MLSVIILAIVQGIAEFLPISSSAHLIIFRDLFGIGRSVITEEMAFTFDIALHFGTLLAIAIFFFKDFWTMVTKGVTKGIKDKEGKMFWFVVFATIPAAIAGLLFEDRLEEIFRCSYVLIGLALIAMGIIMFASDKSSKEKKTLETMTLKDAIIIGCSQIFALIPGFSRSGTTIATSRYLKLDKTSAAKFSFYLSAPVVAGAVVLSLIKDDLSVIAGNAMIFIVGIAVSFIAGMLCIKFLLNYLKKHDFEVFMWYRVLMGLIVIIYSIIK